MIRSTARDCDADKMNNTIKAQAEYITKELNLRQARDIAYRNADEQYVLCFEDMNSGKTRQWFIPPLIRNTPPPPVTIKPGETREIKPDAVPPQSYSGCNQALEEARSRANQTYENEHATIFEELKKRLKEIEDRYQKCLRGEITVSPAGMPMPAAPREGMLDRFTRWLFNNPRPSGLD